MENKIYEEFVKEFDGVLKEVAKLYGDKIKTLRELERLFTKTQCGGPLRPKKMVDNLYNSYKRKGGDNNIIINKFIELSDIAEKYNNYSYFVAPGLETIFYTPF